MNKKSAGRKPQHEESYKIAIVREYITGELGYSELGKKYGLSKATVRRFVNWYQQRYGAIESNALNPGSTAVVPVADADRSGSGSTNERQKDKTLAEAELKIMALEMLIANASKELGIDLIKKLGTKQSNK